MQRRAVALQGVHVEGEQAQDEDLEAADAVAQVPVPVRRAVPLQLRVARPQNPTFKVIKFV